MTLCYSLTEVVIGHPIMLFYYVKDKEQDLDFYISLDNKIENDTVEEIRTPKYKDKMFVFLDKALTDNDKINLSAFVKLKVI